MLVLLYCGCDWQPEPSLVAWAHGLPEGPGRQVTIWAAERLPLFSNGLEGAVPGSASTTCRRATTCFCSAKQGIALVLLPRFEH